jgi:hypothetical protein
LSKSKSVVEILGAPTDVVATYRVWSISDDPGQSFKDYIFQAIGTNDEFSVKGRRVRKAAYIERRMKRRYASPRFKRRFPGVAAMMGGWKPR